MLPPRALAIVAALTLLVAACSSGGDDSVSTEAAPSSTADPGAEVSVPVETDPPVSVPDYSAEAGLLPQAANDASLPEIVPEGSVGAYGFSRYVYQDQGGEVIPTLIEGPQGRQVRCQQLDLACSYTELQALYDSGEPIPDYLEMDRETLGELLDQLDRVNRSVLQYEDLDAACAAGMAVSSTQNANMGIHVIDPGAGSEFNPDRPQMILFAKDGGEVIPRSELGRCEDGEFTGEDGFRPVGAVFNIALTEDHPDAFAGQLDNWHIHLNTCGGSELENADVIEAEVAEAGVPMSREECEASGGFYIPVVSSWMMHAYVVPEYDPQGGVFSMYNPNIWPLADSPEELRDQQTVDTADDLVRAPIVNFDYGDISADVGEPIVFSNADSVPHTVTSGSALDPTSDFDSGVLGTGQTFELSFDQAGEYPLFCVLHPEMQATVSVQ